MRFAIFNCLIFIIEFPLSSATAEIQDNSTLTDARILSRKKRYLNFPDGSILQLGYCLQVAAIFRPDLAFGYTIGTNWDLPSSENIHREEESSHRRHRRDLYAKLEPILMTMGMDGRACVLRALCDAGRRTSVKGSFLQEILYAIFTLPARNTVEKEDSYLVYDKAHRTKRDCASLFPDCPTSLLDPPYYMM